MKRTQNTKAIGANERALLVQVIHGRAGREEAADSLLELERLTDTVGAVVVGSVTQKLDRPTASHFVGKGKLADIQSACRQAAANLIIFDNELSPSQVNNLDEALGIKAIDRTELILQIFARRARSAEAQVQVELAQLQYLVTRIPVSERQARFTGGIGMRGPGESPFQLRAAPMRRRIRDLKDKLEIIQQRREHVRSRRAWPLVCLVGYTNAGKSTLLNAFSPDSAYVDDRLFATLDTKSRLVRLRDGSQFMLIDTVGFIRHLPHGLVASFRSTLGVAAEADLLLIVTDTGHGRVQDHLEVVQETLREVGAHQVPSLLLMNKCDLPGARGRHEALAQSYPQALFISALTGEGMDALRADLMKRFSRRNGENTEP